MNKQFPIPTGSAPGSSGGGGGGGSVGNNPITAVTVALTSTQVSNLGSTPITLVASPGAGKYIYPLSAIFQTGAGSGSSGPALYIGPAIYAGSSGWLTDQGNGLASANAVTESFGEAQVMTLANVENTALVISASFAPNPLALKVILYYQVITA